MLQRFQTIFMAIVVICMGMVANTSLWIKKSSTNNDSVNLNAFTLDIVKGSESTSSTTIYILVAAIIAGLIAIYSISKFKNRKIQMLLGAINSMVIAIVMGFIFYFIFKEGMPAFEPETEGKYGYGFYAGGVALLANMISNRFIRRDENMVRAADRMR